MRIFVAYSYNPRDQWIEDLVFPLVSAFDSTPIHGKDIQGDKLTDEIKNRIIRCHGLVAFVTRRGDQSIEGKFFTHRWVTDELAFASQLGKAVVEVRETDVDGQDGIAGDRVRINYNENNKSDVLLQLIATLARWHRETRRVHVVPLKHVFRDGHLSEVGGDWLRTRRKQLGFRCQYQVLDGDYPSELRDVQLQSIEGRLYFTATQLASGARLRLRITTNEGIFVSDFENVDDVNLRIPLDAPENQLDDPRPRGLEAVLRMG
jgi:hypothetical protein